jgi:hypothetical protein
MLIVISGFIDNPKALHAKLEIAQCSHNETSTKSPLIIERKKLKATQMPSWQRVIPGMFR